MHRVFFKVSAFCLLLSVVIGAFGAHWLKNLLIVEELESIQTGVTYQMIHSIGLFLTGLIYRIYRIERIRIAGYFLLAGIVLFSGSIYLRILLKNIDILNSNWITFFTPLGGISFIIGWMILMLSIPSSKKKYVESKNDD